MKAAIVTEEVDCEAVEEGYKRGLKPATTYCDNVSAKHVVAALARVRIAETF